MARKDKILKSFLTHEILNRKYRINKEELPDTVSGALNSNEPIIKTIALIIDGLEKSPITTDTELRNTIQQYLNNVI
jgi:hypothetical protein